MKRENFKGRTPSILNDQDFREHIKSHPLRWQINLNQKIVDEKREDRRELVEKIIEKCLQI